MILCHLGFIEYGKKFTKYDESIKEPKLIDVACGTGDIAKLYLKYVNELSEITCVDPNEGMINKGKEKLNEYKNLKWLISPAENYL